MADEEKVKIGVHYGRVSDEGQYKDEGGNIKSDASPDAQKEKSRRHIESLNLSSNRKFKYRLIDYLTDLNRSGKDTNRPEYKKLWKLISERKIDFVISPELSRLSRSVRDFLALAEHCDKNCVSLIVIGVDLDSSTPVGRLILLILCALAQFEREMTSDRIKKNNYVRLTKYGRINGAKEILGLIKDKNKTGHFQPDENGLKISESILKLFIKCSSKKSLLQKAKELKLTTPEGQEITKRIVNQVINATEDRYRGIWFIDEEKKQFAQLPHGPLLPPNLLDEVQRKLKDTRATYKRAGKGNHIYLLSNRLMFEDGSKFTGEPGKNRQYRYYKNHKNNLRIRCDELDPIILKKLKSYVRNNENFLLLARKTLAKKDADLALLDSEIGKIRNQEARNALEADNLRKRLVEMIAPTQQIQEWLGAEIEKLGKIETSLAGQRGILDEQRKRLAELNPIDSFEEIVGKFLSQFGRLTQTEQRNALEKIVARVVIRADGKHELHLNMKPSSLNPPSAYNRGEKVRLAVEMVGPPGLEPGTKRL